MKTDLFTSIGIAIAGLVISFFVCNLFLGEIQDYSFKTLNEGIDSELVQPDPEVFNYKALNPTVEVYVGECDKVDSFGECIEAIDNNADDDLEEIIDENESGIIDIEPSMNDQGGE